MAADFPFTAKIVSPAKCNEKPWDLWVGEIGHLSPRRDEAARKGRRRRARLHRLRADTMPLHGLLPQMDELNAAVCHLCGRVLKCSAALRHLREQHAAPEPLLPPPPAPTVKLKPRAKKEPPPPPPPPAPADFLPPKLETSPVHTAAAPLSRVMVPPPEMQYVDEASTSSAVTAEVQICMESGELPVVSIQDTDELPLGDNLTDDIFAIMNSEGIQSADDITNTADWKNIIRDIGNMQDIAFAPSDPAPAPELYPGVDAAAYALSDSELASMQYSSPHAAPSEPSAPSVPARAAPAPASTPGKGPARAKPKSKFVVREYDPNKHCGVATAECPRPCTRSLTCKAHALSLRRLVEGRAKPFDLLLAEHRAARDAPAAPEPAPAEEAGPEPEPGPPEPPPEPCWYAASPRPLALCTFNASHAGGAVTLGKRFATVRANLKSSLSRPGSKAGLARAGARGPPRPELRRLVLCGRRPALADLLDSRLNGHARKPAIDLAFALDPLLGEKC